jgi:redox-sensitive bicupin YhaK (pirin superfamily)
VALEGADEPAPAAAVEITESRSAEVGHLPVRRALPRRARRTVGAWCFVDHMGPAAITPERGVDIAPHPHIGLQTVTWLFDGEILHRDSLGSEQVIRPGQLNLMTAGHGVAHSEEGTGRYEGDLHGVQLWVAQPSRTREDAAAFEHHGELPVVEMDGAIATVLVGELAGTRSPARRDTDHFGADLTVPRGTASLPLRRECEHAMVVCRGAIVVDGQPVEPGHLAYLAPGRDELVLRADDDARGVLVGGVPWAEEPLLMWWNYVARTHEEIDAAHRAWQEGGDRFGQVASPLPRITVGPPPWRSG